MLVTDLIGLMEVSIDPKLTFLASAFQWPCAKINVFPSVDGEADDLPVTTRGLLLDVNECHLFKHILLTSFQQVCTKEKLIFHPISLCSQYLNTAAQIGKKSLMPSSCDNG